MYKALFVLPLVFLSSCSLFQSNDEAEAFALALSGMEVEYNGLADAYDAMVQRMSDPALKAEASGLITTSRTKFAFVLDKARKLLEENMDIDYDKIREEIVKLAEELKKYKDILGLGGE